MMGYTKYCGGLKTSVDSFFCSSVETKEGKWKWEGVG